MRIPSIVPMGALALATLLGACTQVPEAKTPPGKEAPRPEPVRPPEPERPPAPT
jgi:hypothetical protein